MELYVILSWNKMNLYSILDNIPNDSNILIFNLKWMGSDIKSSILNSDRINVIDVELEEDLIETLNTTIIKGNLKSNRIVILKPERIPIYNMLSNIKTRVNKRQIFEDVSYYVFYLDNEIIQNVAFKPANTPATILSNFIDELEYLLNYKRLLRTGLTSTNMIAKQTQPIKKYKVLIYSRCQEKLFEQLKSSGICDSLYSLVFGRNNFNIKLLNTSNNFANDEYFVIVNHYSNDLIKVLQKLKSVPEIKKPTLISDNNNEIYVVNKLFLYNLNINNYFTDIEILKQLKNSMLNKIAVDHITEVETIKIEKAETHANIQDNYFIFILPFMNNGDRYKLFETSVKNLRYNIDKHDIKGEILVHECGNEKLLEQDFIDKYLDQYMFNEYKDVFHRAWCFNVAARYCNIPKKDNVYFIFMDSDMLVDNKWVTGLKTQTEDVLIGWSSLYDLTEDYTHKIVNDSKPIDFSTIEYRNKRFPDLGAACGGVTIIKKDVFFEIKGFPEYFKGTWGGEDNAFMKKAVSFGYSPKIYDYSVCHLYHGHTTVRNDQVRKKWSTDIKNWSDKKWIIETYNIKENWGVGKKITLAMINYLREEKLINTLKNIKHNTRLPLDVVIQLQGRNKMSDETKNRIIECLDKFKSYQIIWNDNNLGTAIPRYNTTQESLKNKSNYTIIVDSDMLLNYGTLELLYNKIEKEPEYGAISCWCKPYYAKWKIEGNTLKQEKLSEGFFETDTLGTGCVIVKTDVFEKAKFNKKLIIGYIDFIWCMEIKTKTNYKLGILCDKNHKILNDARNNSQEYMKARKDMRAIELSKKFIKKTYNISV